MAVFGSSNSIGKWSSSSFGGTGSSFGGSVFGNTTAPAFASSSISGTSLFNQTPSCEGFVPSSSHAGFGITFPTSQATLSDHPFCSTMSNFGTSNQPIFGVTSMPSFVSSPIPSFTSIGTSSGAFSNPTFSASTSEGFEFDRNVDNGQAYPIFGATLSSSARNPTFRSTPTSQLGANNQAIAQPTTPRFGNTLFHDPMLQKQDDGSRFTPYKVTIEANGGKNPGKIHSISAIPTYKQKSHEELRWEDYQLGDKGQSNSLNTSQTPFQFSNLNFSIPTTSSITCAPKTLDYGKFGFHSPMGPSSNRTIEAPSKSFCPPSLNLGSTTCSSLTSLSSPLFISSQFKPSSTLETPVLSGTYVQENPSIKTHSSGLFRSPVSSPSVTSSFPLLGSSHVASSSSTLETPTIVPTFMSSNSIETSLISGPFTFPKPILDKVVVVSNVSTPDFKTRFPMNASTLCLGNNTPSLMSKRKPATTSQIMPSTFSGFQPLIPNHNFGKFPFDQVNSATSMAATGFHGTSMQISSEKIYQHHGTHSEMVASQIPIENPFGTLPTTPTILIERSPGKVPSIQYGIASMPVIDKTLQLRKISSLTPRHISQRSRNRMRSRTYNFKSDSPKVSFYNGSEEALCNSDANAIFIPRENPRALFIQQSDQSPSTNNVTNQHRRSKIMKLQEHCWTPEVDVIAGQPSLENSSAQEPQSTTDTWPSADTDNPDLYNSPLPSKSVDKFTSEFFTRQNVSLEEHNPKGSGYVSISRNRNGESATTYMHATEIEDLMPKLWHSDYYMEPTIQELTVKEGAQPDYCSQVKDFVVGRRGYGSVKFFGETDVRCLDLEDIIQFNKCEILVYMDESKKPPLGQGLNKPAEISLLNVKCKDKKTGKEFLKGPEVENFEKRLKRKTEEQGARFISYNASKGEWKFQVKHFSRYCLDGFDSK